MRKEIFTKGRGHGLMKTFLVLLLCSAGSLGLRAEWNPVAMYGGSVSCVTSVDSIVYAGTMSGGVFRLNKDMDQWMHVSYKGMSSGRIRSIAGMGEVVVAGTQDEGVFVSRDKGASWTKANTNITNLTVQAMMAKGGLLFAGTNTGAYYSTDTGTSWTALSNGMSGVTVTSLMNTSKAVYAGTDGSGIYKLDMGTMTWSQVNTGMASISNTRINSMVESNGTLYVGTSKGFLVSPESAISWVDESAGFVFPSVNSVIVANNKLYAATSFGVYSSDMTTISWAEDLTGMGDISVIGITAANNTLVAGAVGAGLYAAPLSTLKWDVLEKGFNNKSTYTMTAKDSVVMVTTNEGLYWSKDNGKTFTLNNTGITDYLYISAFGWSGKTVYAGTGEGTIFKGDNFGATWTEVSTGLASGEAVVAIVAGKGDSLWAAQGNGEVFVSKKSSVNWTKFMTGLPAGMSISGMAIYKDSVFVSAPGKGVFVSYMGGNWQAFNTGLTNIQVTGIAVAGGNIYAGTDGDGIFMSRADSMSWKAANSGITDKYIMSVAAFDSNYIAAGHRGGVYITYNRGANWKTAKSIHYIPSYTEVRAIHHSQSNMFFVTPNNGAYYNSLSELPEAAGIAPRHYAAQEAIFTLYPNPNSGTFNIDLKELKGKVRNIEIYSITGQLIDSYSGRETTIHSELPEGMYLVQVKTATQVYTQRMIVR